MNITININESNVNKKKMFSQLNLLVQYLSDTLPP